MAHIEIKGLKDEHIPDVLEVLAEWWEEYVVPAMREKDADDHARPEEIQAEGSAGGAEGRRARVST